MWLLWTLNLGGALSWAVPYLQAVELAPATPAADAVGNAVEVAPAAPSAFAIGNAVEVIP